LIHQSLRVTAERSGSAEGSGTHIGCCAVQAARQGAGPAAPRARRPLASCRPKGAIHSFTKVLAQNLIDQGIRVNAGAPGYITGIVLPVTGSIDAI
jgi:NAD(P)-dependent dehydrogenase (short-subunit alcohol dehydrogenase family)